MSEQAVTFSSLAFVIIFSLVISAFILRNTHTCSVRNPQELNATRLSPSDSSAEVSLDAEEYCFELSEDVIHKTYPLHAQGFEPWRHLDSLNGFKPESVTNLSALRRRKY